jgi:hypothetical protein
MYMARVPYLRSLKTILRHLVFMAIAAASSILVSCIERTNPFDPINSAPQAVVDLRKQDRPALVAITGGEPAFTAFLKGLLDEFADDSTANGDLVKDNALRRGKNLATETANAGVDSFNLTQTVKDSLRLKAEFVRLHLLQSYGPYPGFAENRIALRNLAATLKTHFTLKNAGHFPLVVYDPAFIDSVFEPFVRDSLVFALAEFRFDSASRAVSDSNSVLGAYNDQRDAENRRVRSYNDSIIFLKRVQNAVVIGRSDSLQAGAFAAKAGDSLFLGPGTFNVDLRFANTGTADSPIVVSGFPGRSTIIRPSLSGAGSDHSLVIGSGKRHIRFVNLVFRGGVKGNVKLEGGASDITFRNCLFDSSAGTGFEAYDSEFRIEDCEILANADVGVKLGGGISLGGWLRLTNVLIARNGKAGVHTTSQLLEMRNCTIAENGGDGIQIISPLQEVAIFNTLIAANRGFGIEREATIINQQEFDVTASNLFGNETGNWFLPQMDSSVTAAIFAKNLSENPQFTDAPGFDYTPMPGSFLDVKEMETPPLVIGYRRPAP